MAESESLAVARWQQWYFAIEGVGQISGGRGRHTPQPLLVSEN